MLKLKIIACDVMRRELSHLMAASPHYVDIDFLYQGLHNTPDLLRADVQKAVDAADAGFPYNHSGTEPHYDYILLIYGLCSNGLSGIRAGKVPMVIPKAHDCITLLLGSKERYQSEFNNNPGTYWYSSGWIERGWQPSEKKYKAMAVDFLNRYGEENAEWLVEQELASLKTYKRAAFIHMQDIGQQVEHEAFTQHSASFLDLHFERIEGDIGILARMLNGEFLPDETVIVPPGFILKPSFDDQVLTVIPPESGESSKQGEGTL